MGHPVETNIIDYKYILVEPFKIKVKIQVNVKNK